MSDPTTTNRSLAVPVHASDVDTWDQPLNSNFGKLDTIVGGVASISTTGGVTGLNAAQLANGTISISGALASTVTIAFPVVQGWWTIENLTTGNFALVVGTTGAEIIAIPQGGLFDIQINGGAARFRNLPMVGSYMDIASASMPLWIQNCTKPPYLLCDGSTFSAVTYPALATFLGGTTLPDFRGRAPYYLNLGSGRLTSAGAGIDGNTVFASGGVNGVTLAANQLPTHASSGSNTITVNSTTALTLTGTIQSALVSGGSDRALRSDAINQAIVSSGLNTINVSYTNASQQIVGNAAPGVMSGLRLIRAA